MTETLERAIEQIKRLPRERQDEVGEMLLSMIEQDASGLRLSPEQLAEVDRILAEPQEVVPEHEVKAFFRKLTQ
jgi:hypothetical protein